MTINITRDSVCAGDDSDAPHEWALEVDPFSTLGELFEAIARRTPRYLAGIQGGMATWVAEAGEPLAMVCEQHSGARFFLDPEILVSSAFAGRSGLHFYYLAQVDPEFVWVQLGE